MANISKVVLPSTDEYNIKDTVARNGLNRKQDTLVSGTNIKTINNTSLLGSGNIDISGGDNVFVVKRNITTYNELITAIEAGKYLCFYEFVNGEYCLDWINYIEEDTGIYLSYFTGTGRRNYFVSTSDVWSLESESSFLLSDQPLDAHSLTGQIPSSVTAITQSSGDNSTKLATTAYVDGAVAVLPEPMIFKGSLGTGGTITALPAASSSNEGFVYKVITAGTYDLQAADVGDTFISDGSSWVLIPSGDEPSGTVTSIATGNGLSGGPITSSGTIALDTAYGDLVNPYGSKTANYVLAAPNGSNGVPLFRALVANDLPNGNLVNGSQTGSLRTIGSTPESESYTIGANAVAEGLRSKASGPGSHAEGYNTKASGAYSHAEGNNTTASDGNSHAEGIDTTASGYSSHAEGMNTTASGDFSHAEGINTTASEDSSHAQNNGTIASKSSQTALGRYNIEDTDTSSAYGKCAVIVGNGTTDNNRSNALTVDWGGNTEQQGRATTKDLTPTQIDTIIQELGLHGRTICPYDVGDIYITRNTIDPSEKWEGTTWRQLKDTFLLGAGDTYSAGSTGGASRVTLTVDQMPSHDHAINGIYYQRGSGNYETYGYINKIGGDHTGYSDNSGGGQAHENMPPYLAVFMWERLS